MSGRHRHIVMAGALVAVGLVLGIPANAAGDGRFSDDDGIPAERNIEHVVELGLMDPCDVQENSRFCPGEPVGTVEAATGLLRAGRRLSLLPPLPIDGAAGDLAESLVSNELVPESMSIEAVRAAWDVLLGASPQDAETTIDSDGPDTATRAELAEFLATAIGADQCTDEPFTKERVASLKDRFPSQIFQAYAFDIRSGCAYWMNPDERLRPASVFKVMVLAGTLLEAQSENRDVTASEMDRLVPMITESANWPVRSLWREFGAAPWFIEQAETFGMSQTDAVGDYGRSWGATTTSAKDQADLIRQLLLGDRGPLDSEYRDVALALMTSVIESQTWGVTSGVPDGWTVAQKNGFAGSTTSSVGYVEEPDGDGGYIVAVLTDGWPHWRSGVQTVEEIAGWVSEALAHQSP